MDKETESIPKPSVESVLRQAVAEMAECWDLANAASNKTDMEEYKLQILRRGQIIASLPELLDHADPQSKHLIPQDRTTIEVYANYVSGLLKEPDPPLAAIGIQGWHQGSRVGNKNDFELILDRNFPQVKKP